MDDLNKELTSVAKECTALARLIVEHCGEAFNPEADYTVKDLRRRLARTATDRTKLPSNPLAIVPNLYGLFTCEMLKSLDEGCSFDDVEAIIMAHGYIGSLLWLNDDDGLSDELREKAERCELAPSDWNPTREGFTLIQKLCNEDGDYYATFARPMTAEERKAHQRSPDGWLGMVEAKKISLAYTNHRGEHAMRSITPIQIHYGSTDWHPQEGWLLTAMDHDKGALRDFALKDMDFTAGPNIEDHFCWYVRPAGNSEELWGPEFLTRKEAISCGQREYPEGFSILEAKFRSVVPIPPALFLDLFVTCNSGLGNESVAVDEHLDPTQEQLDDLAQRIHRATLGWINRHRLTVHSVNFGEIRNEEHFPAVAHATEGGAA